MENQPVANTSPPLGKSDIKASSPAILARPHSSDPKPRPTSEQIEAERVKRIRVNAWRAACIPRRHAALLKSNSESWDEKYNALAERLGSGFLAALLGDRGTGKTKLAAELVRCHTRTSSRPSALYTRAIEFFMAIRESYRKDGPTEREQLAIYTRPTLLVIDDAHEKSESAWENRLFALLVDIRYSNLRDTLLISNQKLDEFKISVGASVYSRLVETGGVIVCNWPSFRRSNANRMQVER